MTKYLMPLGEDEVEKEIYFRVACDCGDPKHDSYLTFKSESFHGHTDITLSIDFPVISYNSYYASFFDKLKWRIKTAFDILVNGYADGDINIIITKDNYLAFKEAMRLSEEKLK